jgi:hypothetical protein
MDDQDHDEYTHEDTLQAALVAAFTGDYADLTDLCEDAGLPALRDADGHEVTVSAAHTYRDAGVLTTNRGVVLDLSDGSQFQLTVVISRSPHA